MSAIECSVPRGSLATKLFVYVSRPAEGLTTAMVHDLLIHARRHNAMDGMHGLLTYDRRGFLQVLEGTEGAVDHLLASIGRDPRHRDMQLLLLEPPAAPMFTSFFDLVLEGDDLATLAMLHPRSLERLSPTVIHSIERGYAMLDRPA